MKDDSARRRVPPGFMATAAPTGSLDFDTAPCVFLL
jgi:hypothetical protein